ncbi:hypothetical protein NE237_003208 [Protea cynaroides]|uniref:Cytochrome P450 n=1 Tax=Protea cynaroides TaxID=273540 RepID=A0A9Q0QSI1_9MAGN|nr:hypothetical protein NE237_003208 [Protea cynaroides]
MADKYGPAFTVRLGMRRALVVSNWEVAKECFTVNDRTLATRPKSIAIKYLGYDYAIFGFSHYGPYWREVRKIVTLELLSNRRLEMFRHVRILEVQTSMKELYQMCAAKNKVDMTKWLGDLTLNIIVRMVAGNRFFVTDTGEKLVCQQGIRDCLYFLGVFIMSDALPFLEGLDVQGHERRMKKSAKNMDTILQRWLEDHRRERSSMSSSYKTRVEQDFMDVMISSMEETKISDYDADTVIKATCLNVILGGNDTTVVTLTWALSLLLNNRHGFELATPSDEPVDMTESSGLTNLKATPLEILLIPRLPSKLYQC